MKKKQFVFIIIFSIIIMGVIVYSVSSGPGIKIRVDGDGVFLKHNLRGEKYTVVWECDAGSLSSVSNNQNYKAPPKSPYYLYVGLNDKVKWSPKDDDGFSYSTATLKAHIYKYEGENCYSKCDSKVYTDMLTLSIQNNKLVQTDKRIFGNPVRKNSDDNWQQILVLDQQKKYVTLRYRFGKTLNSLERICWKTNVTSLCDATFQDAPIYVPYGFNNEQYFFDNNTVCYDFSKFNNVYFDGTNVEQYPANIKIQAFVVDKKKKYTNIANLSIKYYYGEEDYYSFSS